MDRTPALPFLQHRWSRSHLPHGLRHPHGANHPGTCYPTRGPDVLPELAPLRPKAQWGRSADLHGNHHSSAGIDLKHCAAGRRIQSEGTQ